jgi:pimeloyl-ACP methyl ester carboxylesterase
MPNALGALAALAAAFFIGIAAAAADTDVELVTEEFRVPAKDAGIELYVRNKHPEALRSFSPERTLLFVHGATYPSETTFDLAVGGFSWMDYVARRGFDVYLMDVRGYGSSTRPKEFDEPPDANPPIVDTAVALGDVAAVVEFGLERRGIPRLGLLGWSWGTTLVAAYAADKPEKVQRLGLYAPIWVPSWRVQDLPTLGAYRSVDREAAFERWTRGVPAGRRASLVPEAWRDTWWNAVLASDPVGATREPAVVRAPNGVLHDIRNNWLSGKPMYDPGRIEAPTLLVVGEWDQDTEPAMAEALLQLLTKAPEKRLVVVPEATHMLMLEANRMALIAEMQRFFEEDAIK